MDDDRLVAELQMAADQFRRAAEMLVTWPDRRQAIAYANKLGELAQQLTHETRAVRADIARKLKDEENLTLSGLGTILGISKARAHQLLNPRPRQTQHDAEE